MFPAHDFRCHPVWRADHRVPLLVALDVGAEPEVGDLHPAIRTKKNVVRFDVPVQDAALVEVVHALQDLKEMLSSKIRKTSHTHIHM